MPADEVVDEADSAGEGGRRFLSGPLSFGPAMLTTPSCSLGAQRTAGYAHPVRTLVPILPTAELERGIAKETALPDLRSFHHLINYTYLPPLELEEPEFAMPESVALLYMPVTVHHDLIDGNRVAQLAYRGAQQLQRKLVWFYSGWLEDDLDLFDPPMD